MSAIFVSECYFATTLTVIFKTRMQAMSANTIDQGVIACVE
jgi:hypothetical protein